MRKSIQLFVLLGAITIAISCQQTKDAVFDKMLVDAANEVNKNCPMVVDKETRLDNAVALPNKCFQYNYTLVNLVKDSLDTSYIKEFLTPKAINALKTNPSLKPFRDNKVTMCYMYKDKNDQYVCSIKVKPEDYK